MILKEFNPGIVKLHGGDDPLGMLGYVLRDAAPRPDAVRMSCRVTISTSTPDRSGDTVVQRGWLLDEHQRNPVVLLAHQRNIPIGSAEDPLGGYTVKVFSDARTEAETFFDQHSEVGEQSFRLVETKVLRGASVGFLPVAGMVEKSAQGGTIYKAAKLVEYSHLAVPDNPECLVEAVYKGFGGKPLCTPLLDLLKPLVPERKPVVTSGFSPAPVVDQNAPRVLQLRTKMYPDTTDDPMIAPPPEATPEPMEEPEAPGSDMKPFAQLVHSIHELIMQGLQMLDDGVAGTEHKPAGKMADKVKSAFGKALETIQSAYEGYQAEHDDQPDLPATDIPDEAPADEAAANEGTPAESDEAGGTVAETDEEKKEDKALAGWRRKSVEQFRSYWQGLKAKAISADAVKVKAAIEFFDELAGNKAAGSALRSAARFQAKELRTALKAKPAAAPESKPAADDSAELLAMFSGLQQTLNQQVGRLERVAAN